MRIILSLLAGLVLIAAPSRADDLRLAVPEALAASGLAHFIVPRFSLKTGVRITQVPHDAEAEMRFTDAGAPLFIGAGAGWSLAHNGDPRADRFADWLRSDVGKRTVSSYTGPNGETFVMPVKKAVAVAPARYAGDVALGEKLSLTLCGRCHVINEKNRMNGMGSTPSFAVLRAFGDWDDRFQRFFLLNPHPAFTQVAGISEPFDPSLPSPIVPLEMTQADLEAILAYVQGVAPADLGKPLQFQ